MCEVGEGEGEGNGPPPPPHLTAQARQRSITVECTMRSFVDGEPLNNVI